MLFWMSRKPILIWGFLWTFIFTFIHAKRDYTIEITQILFNISSDITYVKHLNTSIIGNKKSNLHVLFDQDIKEIPGEASLMVHAKSGRRIVIFQIKSEACYILAQGTKNVFISVFVKEILRNSNFPKKCPLSKNKLYYVKNYTIDDESYPPYLPETQWQFDIKGKPNNIGVITLSLSGRVRKL